MWQSYFSLCCAPALFFTLESLDIMDELAGKLARLEDILQRYETLGIALACRDDNPLLANIAKQILGQRVFALNAEAEFLVEHDVDFRQTSFMEQGLELLTIPTRAMQMLDFLENGPRRCYYCRLYVLGALTKAGRHLGVQHIAVGVTTDLLARKPETIEAIQRLDVEMPFIEADINDAEARAIAGQLGFAMPGLHCLAERFAPGLPLDDASMAFVADAEVFLHNNGLNGSVKLIGDGELEIEMAAGARALEAEIRQEIEAFMRARHYKIMQWKQTGIIDQAYNIPNN